MSAASESRRVISQGSVAKAVLGVKVPRAGAEDLRTRLTALRLVDKSKSILEDGDMILIPLLGAPRSAALEEFRATVVDFEFPDRKSPKVDPIILIRKAARIPEELKQTLPDKWELLGDVVIIRLGDEFVPYLREVGEAYGYVLKSKAVLREVGAIEGEFREPKMSLIFGTDTETMHVENHVRFRLDAARTMFSSGNEEERIRMATIRCDGETVIDMFAGIGYFSIPLAVYQNPSKVIACEINPVAYRYLEENIALNKVEGKVLPVLGDNRGLQGESIADRIVMGYVKTTHEFLSAAVRLIKSGGIVHYHETCPNDLLPARPIQRLQESVKNGTVEIMRHKEIKSYAPGVSHVVVDARIIKPS